MYHDIIMLLNASGSHFTFAVLQLTPGQSYTHKLTLVFLLVGKYYMDIKNHLSVEGPPMLHVKLPVSSSTPQIETTTKETPLSVSLPTSPAEIKIPDDAKNLSSLLLSPPPTVTSPPWGKPVSPSRRRSATPSPDSPANKARQLAMRYEANLLARDATVYKDTKASAKNSKDTEKMSTSPIPLSPIEDQTTSLCAQTADDTKVAHEELHSPEADLLKKSQHKPKHRVVNPSDLNTLLLEFAPEDHLLKSTPVSQTKAACSKYPIPPPLPTGFHGKITESSNNLKDQFCTMPKQNQSSRFQKLLRLSAQNPKLVRVFSGPHITFSVS